MLLRSHSLDKGQQAQSLKVSVQARNQSIKRKTLTSSYIVVILLHSDKKDLVIDFICFKVNPKIHITAYSIDFTSFFANLFDFLKLLLRGGVENRQFEKYGIESQRNEADNQSNPCENISQGVFPFAPFVGDCSERNAHTKRENQLIPCHHYFIPPLFVVYILLHYRIFVYWHFTQKFVRKFVELTS